MLRRGGARLALCVGLALAVAAPAGAIETQHFGVEPYPLFDGDDVRRSFDVSLEPGGTHTEQLRVWNKRRKPIEIRLYGAGVQVTGGQYQVAPFESRSGGIGDWVVPDRSTLRLGPGEDAVVSFTVQAPPVMDGGPRLAAIVAESETGVSSGGVDVVARLAMLVNVEQDGGGLWGVSWWIWLAVALLAAAVVAAAIAHRRSRRSRDGAGPQADAPRVLEPAGL